MTTSDDRTQELKEIFSRFDGDGNGRIDQSEFSRLLESLGAGLSDEEALAAFEHIDRNDDGSIDFDELRAWWKFQAG